MRYQRRYGIHTFSDNSREQMHATIASQLGGFKSSVAARGAQIARDQAATKANDEANHYDPQTTPELKKKNNRAAQVYNTKVLQAHQQAVDVRYKQRLIELADEYKDEPELFDAAAQKRFDMLKSELHPELHGQLPTYDHLRFVESKRIRDRFIKNQEAAATESTHAYAKNEITGVQRHVRNGDHDLAIEQASAFKEAIRNSAALDDGEKAAYLSEIDQRMVQAATTYELDQLDPVDAFAQIEAYRGEVPEQFTPDEWDKFISQSITRQNARHSNLKKIEADRQLDIGRQVGDLERRIALIDADTDPEEIEFIYGEIEARYQDGMGDSKRTQMLKTVDSQLELINERQQAVAAIVKRSGGDDSVLVDQSYIDEAWPQVESSLPEDPLARNAEIAKISSSLGYIPKTVKAQVSNNLKSTNTDTLIDTIDLVDRLQEYRNLPDQFPKQELAYAQQLQSLMTYLPPEQAVEKALQITNPDNPLAEGRQKWIDEQKSRKKLNFMEEAEDAFDTWGVDVDDLNRFPIDKDFENLTTAYYTAGMDFDAAKKQAERDMRNTWAKDGVTGRLMKYPPSNFYAVNNKVDWVGRQLKKDVLDNDQEYKNLYLTSDLQTAREASLGRPSYLVWGVTEDGIEPVMVEGGQARFHPDIDAERKRVTKANELKMRDERGPKASPSKSVKDIILPDEGWEAVGSVVDAVWNPVKRAGKMVADIPKKANIEAAYFKEHGRNPSPDEVSAILAELEGKKEDLLASR